jgi:hypothetical protein
VRVATNQTRTVHAHRVAWRLTHALEPTGPVLHRCDNPPCCNPRHLYVGTPADNSADAVARQRTPRGDRTRRAKLTWNQAREVRLLAVQGISNCELGRRFGVSETAIRFVIIGKTWRPFEQESLPVRTRG